MLSATHTRTWPSLVDVPALYPDARNRVNRGPLLYRAGKCFPLERGTDLAGRTAVLAVGSNGYPRQLHDKLAGTSADLQGVPLLPIILSGFDVAFCPVRSRKGYVPVTLAERPDAICLTWLQWLTVDQLNLISASEGSRYALVGSEHLAASARTPAQWPRPPIVYAWWFDSLLCSRDGPVWLDIYRPHRSQQAGLDIEHGRSCPNPTLESWLVVPRDAQTHRIDADFMSQLC